MIGLLLAIAKGRGTNDQAVVLLASALALRPSLTASLGATLVIRLDLGAVGYVIKVPGDLLADDGHLLDSPVAKHVHDRPVIVPLLSKKTLSKSVSMLPNPPSVKPEAAPYITPPGADIEPD